VSVTVTVTANGGTPTGTIAISADTGESCQISLPATTCSLVFQTTGTRTVTANYPGDSQDAPSSENTSHTVVAGGGGNPGNPGDPSVGNRVVYVSASFVNAALP
jgi:hypothetical protein